MLYNYDKPVCTNESMTVTAAYHVDLSHVVFFCLFVM